MIFAAKQSQVGLVVVYLCASWAAQDIIFAVKHSQVGLVVVYLCASWAAYAMIFAAKHSQVGWWWCTCVLAGQLMP